MPGETILLIDTDSETEEMVVSTLETEGYLVFTAPGGDVGVTMAEKVGPSLIFVNAAAAGRGGLEICKTIHDVKSLKNVPIIILTSFEGAMDPRYTSLYGIVDFLKKPFSPQELIEKTGNVLAMRSLDAQLVTDEALESVKIVTDLSREEDRTNIEQEMPDIQKDHPEYKDVSKLSEIDQSSAETEKEQKEKGDEEEKKEPEETYALEEDLREESKKSRILIPVIVLTLIIIVTAGILLYRDSGHKPAVQTPVVVKPPPPVELHGAEVVSSQEQQKQEQSIEELKPPPVSEPVTAPVTVPEPEPAGKTIYSVQLGAFKNKDNAVPLIKRYKEKGYEVFIHKGTAKDKGILYRVLIGKFEDRKESSKMANRIRAKEKIDVTIYGE